MEDEQIHLRDLKDVLLTRGDAEAKPDFIEKRLYWGLCYGILDTKRMAAVIIEGGHDARARAKAMIADVKDGHIRKDEYVRQIEVKMREWEIRG